MNALFQHILFLTSIVVLPLLSLLLPLVIYLISGWNLRKREILSCFTDSAIICYFQTFLQTDYELYMKNRSNTVNEIEASDNDEISPADMEMFRSQLERHYSENFGRGKFILPGLLLMTIATCFLSFFAISTGTYLVNSSDLWNGHFGFNVFLGTLAGFAGGYMWVLKYLISRMQSRQLSPSDLCWGSFRLIVSIPIALSFIALLKGALQEHALYAIAFMLGAFPMQTLTTFMRRTAASRLGLQDSLDETAAKLAQLQGIGRDQGEIFEQEGVGTILQLAYSDPVDLTIRTGFSFSYVVDCCSQALAWLCLEDIMTKLRRFAIRGAQEITTLVYELSRNTAQSKKVMDQEQIWAEKTLDILAVDLNMNKDALRRTLDEIAYDPYAQFLYNVWQSDWN